MADEQIVTNIVAKSDFSGLIRDLNQVQSALTQLQQTTANTNKTLANQIRVMNRQFGETLRSTGQFSTQFVSIGSDVEKFGKSLDSGKLKLNEFYRTWQTHAKTSGGLVRDLAKQQVQLQNAILQPVGKNAQGMMQFAVHVPKGLDVIKNKTAIARQEMAIMNRVMQQGANQLINWGKNTQWAGRQLTVGMTVPLMAFGKAATDAFRQADAELVRLTKVYGGLAPVSQKELTAIRNDVARTANEISKAYGTSYTETIALAADIAATGKQGNDLLASTRETSRLAVLGEVDKQTAMKATLAIQNTFKQNTDQLSQSIDFLNAVENQTSTSLADLIEAIPKAGPVIQAMGGSVKDLALYLTAMKEGGINASEGANALKSALASLVNPTQKSLSLFRSYGIDLGGIVTKNAGHLTDTILALQTALDNLNPLERQRAIEQLFGKFQFARLNALFANLGKQGSQTLQVLDLMKASAQDLANVAGRELAQMTESASGRYKRAIEGLKADLAGTGEQFLNFGTRIINFIDKIINFMNHIPKPLKQILSFIGGLAAIAGPIIMLTGVLGNFFGYIVKGVYHFKSLFKGAEGWKLLTPEILAASKAGQTAESVMYSDAKAADILALAIKNLRNEYTGLSLSAATASKSQLHSFENSLAQRMVDPNNPLLSMVQKASGALQYAKSYAHLIPRKMEQPGTIFGTVPTDPKTNLLIRDNPQIYMSGELPNIPGLTTVPTKNYGNISTGVVASEAAKHHAMTATLAMQSEAEIADLKKTIALTGAVSSEFTQTFDEILPITTKVINNAALESEKIVNSLKAGEITLAEAKAKIVALNARIEQELASSVQGYAAANARNVGLYTVPGTTQPVSDASGRTNMREMTKKQGGRSLIQAISRAFGIKTSGAAYSWQTTMPIQRRNSGGPIYYSSGSIVPGPNVNADVVPAMLTPGEFVVNREAAARNMPLLTAINKGYNNGGTVPFQRGHVGPQISGSGLNIPNLSSSSGNTSYVARGIPIWMTRTLNQETRTGRPGLTGRQIYGEFVTSLRNGRHPFEPLITAARKAGMPGEEAQILSAFNHMMNDLNGASANKLFVGGTANSFENYFHNKIFTKFGKDFQELSMSYGTAYGQRGSRSMVSQGTVHIDPKTGRMSGITGTRNPLSRGIPSGILGSFSGAGFGRATGTRGTLSSILAREAIKILGIRRNSGGIIPGYAGGGSVGGYTLTDLRYVLSRFGLSSAFRSQVAQQKPLSQRLRSGNPGIRMQAQQEAAALRMAPPPVTQEARLPGGSDAMVGNRQQYMGYGANGGVVGNNYGAQFTQTGINATKLLRFSPSNLVGGGLNLINSITPTYIAGLKAMRETAMIKASVLKTAVTDTAASMKSVGNVFKDKLLSGATRLAFGMAGMYQGMLNVGKAINTFGARMQMFGLNAAASMSKYGSQFGLGFREAAFYHRQAQGIPQVFHAGPFANQGVNNYLGMRKNPRLADYLKGMGRYAGSATEVGNITRANLMASGLSAARADQMIGVGAQEGAFSQRKKAGFYGLRRTEFLDAQGKALSAAEARQLGLTSKYQMGAGTQTGIMMAGQVAGMGLMSQGHTGLGTGVMLGSMFAPQIVSKSVNGIKGVVSAAGGMSKAFGSAKAAGAAVFQILSKLAFAGPLLAVVAVIAAAAYAFKKWRNEIERTRKEQSLMFGTSATQAKDLGYKYRDIGKEMKAARAQSELMRQTGMGAFESVAKYGSGFTITIKEMKNLISQMSQAKTEIKTINEMDMSTWGSENAGRVNEMLIQTAKNLKEQYIATGDSVDVATAKVFALLKNTKYANQAFNVINDKGFRSIVDAASAASMAVKDYGDQLAKVGPGGRFAGGKQQGEALQNVLTLMQAATDESQKQILDEEKKNTASKETHATYQSIYKTMENISKQNLDNTKLTQDQLDWIKKTHPELEAMLTESDNIVSSFAKMELQSQGVLGDFKNLGADAAVALEKFAAALKDSISNLPMFQKANSIIAALQKAYVADTVGAQKSAADEKKAYEASIKLIELKIGKINEEADARKKAIEAEFASQDYTNRLRQEELKYRAAVASGNQDAATAAQLNIKALTIEQSKQAALAAIEDKRNADLAIQAAARQKADDAHAAAQDKLAAAQERATNNQIKMQKLQSFMEQYQQILFTAGMNEKLYADNPTELNKRRIETGGNVLNLGTSIVKEINAAANDKSYQKQLIDALSPFGIFTKNAKTGALTAVNPFQTGAEVTAAKGGYFGSGSLYGQSQYNMPALQDAVKAATANADAIIGTDKKTLSDLYKAILQLQPNYGTKNAPIQLEGTFTSKTDTSKNTAELVNAIQSQAPDIKSGQVVSYGGGSYRVDTSGIERYDPYQNKWITKQTDLGKDTVKYPGVGTLSDLNGQQAKTVFESLTQTRPRITGLINMKTGQPTVKLAGGGLIKGPGTGTSDSIFMPKMPMGKYASGAFVSNGEYILPASAVSYYGTDVLDSLRTQSMSKQLLATALRANGVKYGIPGGGSKFAVQQSQQNATMGSTINIDNVVLEFPDTPANARQLLMEFKDLLRQENLSKTGGAVRVL